ncbi:MAG: AraC family transcriptional regulator [Bacillota bacterium]|nr:AraC family transcriptional regulator [Bacillota bacterium]
MDWIEHLNSVVNYIDENLDKEISYERIAQIAGCSVYNFQRMFSYIADKPLSEYIRNRRLTMAAFDVINSREKIIDIALKYGYDSHDSFTRAFQRFHGVLPSEARNETVRLKSCPKLSFQITIKGEEYMNYQIEQWPAFTITGFKKRVKTDDAFNIVPQLWNTAWSDGTMGKLFELFKHGDYRPSGFLGVAVEERRGNSEEMDYYLAVTTHVDVPQCKNVETPEGMSSLEFPPAAWVIFDASGELPDAVQKVYKNFYTEWLPNSGYGLVDLPIVECYMQENRQEVWVAIKPIDK